MKKRITLRSISLSLLIFLMTACSSDDDKHAPEIEVRVCGQKNPDWLQQEVNNIIKRIDGQTSVYIYCLSKKSKEYVALHSQRIYSSRYPDYLQLFECSGREIISESKEYETLWEDFILNEFELIWEYPRLSQK